VLGLGLELTLGLVRVGMPILEYGHGNNAPTTTNGEEQVRVAHTTRVQIRSLDDVTATKLRTTLHLTLCARHFGPFSTS